MRGWFFGFLTLFVAVSSAVGAEILSPFAGSTDVGTYETDFVKFHYLVQDNDEVEIAVAEGRLISRLYKKPDSKSNYEIFRSYEKELEAAGFEMLAVLDDVKKAELLARKANGQTMNNLVERAYTHEGKAVGAGDKARVGTQGQEYIAAEKTVDNTQVVIVVNTSRSGYYLVEQFEAAAMDRGTVKLTLDNLNKTIESEGRIAIYGIHFDTGSAEIQPSSSETIATIVAYLKANPERYFYVVGHTDDQGPLPANMQLSQARAQAVVDAVTAELQDAEGRLFAKGVGPLSPVATNGADDGRALNRRVELVSTHK